MAFFIPAQKVETVPGYTAALLEGALTQRMAEQNRRMGRV